MNTRIGDWMQTRNGIRYYPNDPHPEDVSIHDIAWALSNMCRFGGHVDFYSVAEHSVLVSRVVPPEFALQGLLHDATEAYVVDVPRPLKLQLTNYAEIEEKNWLAVAKRFSLPVELHPSVKQADNDVLLAEKEALLARHPYPWNVPGTPANVPIVGYEPARARALFMERFAELTL